MKLSTLAAKLTFTKAHALRALGLAALVGAALTAAAPAAQAQRFGVAVQFGRPYYAPAPAPPAYYGYRYDGWRARQDFIRHEQWERFHHERPYGYWR